MLLIITAAALFILTISLIVSLALVGRFLNKRHVPVEPIDAALVFGTGLAWKAEARSTTAAELFQRGLVRYLIVSGGVRVPNTDLTEAEWFRAKLIALGVPAERILLENRATNTAENVEFSLPLIEQFNFESVVLVMSDFEGIRAHLTAKRAWQGRNIKIYDCHAPSTGHWHASRWWLTREGRALTWYTVPRLFRYRLWKYLR
jgi:uncharacterized SAM-binding protein YcdF (DUF218 family)